MSLGGLTPTAFARVAVEREYSQRRALELAVSDDGENVTPLSGGWGPRQRRGLILDLTRWASQLYCSPRTAASWNTSEARIWGMAMRQHILLVSMPFESTLPAFRRVSVSAWIVAGAATCAGIALIHARWVLGHFSTDGYLLDSGWLAFLLEAADPLLRNPAAVNDLSFYAHHISPHLFLFGAPVARLLHLNGFEILAVHEAVFFGLFAIAALWGAYVNAGWRHLTLGFLAAVAVGAFSNILLQAAGYPHYEIAMLAVTALCLVAWERGWRRLFVVCVIWLPLIREDGGFYAAFVGLVSWVIAEPSHRTQYRGLLLAVFCGGVTVSAGSMVLKSTMFPGFDAFESNFSGQSWSHLSWSFVMARAYAAIINPNIVPVLLGSVALAWFDLRYAAGLVLLLPLFVLHLLSVRDEHGHFTLYFALPWLLPAVLWIILWARRQRLLRASVAEGFAIVSVAIAMTAPAQAAVGIQANFWYLIAWSFDRPIHDLDDMRQFARNAHRSFASTGTGGRLSCASVGVAALIPNDLRPQEVIDPAAGISTCRTVLLMVGDMQSAAVSVQLEALRFQRVSERAALQLWWRPDPPPEGRPQSGT